MAERTLRAIGRPELIDDPKFKTNADRVRHAAELDALIGAFVGQHTQAEAVAIFDRAEVTAGPIYDVSQIVVDPHVIERELLADYPDQEMGLLPMHHVVPRLLGTPGSVRLPAPWLGQHNREILKPLGIAGDAYQALVKSGIAIESRLPPSKQPQ
jgi:formyl-CoA transferase